ncbi:SpoIIE family protein phosphatase [Streptomyces sp. NBC_00582]|uniref:SpoIIE family protein phosphatase n=1 Tax=Streptomyces sp. NBC_00582 TaxID=2975783 RepID=UPI002E809E36|nr:SpoIIE family protein phosphatase [Streptomyces sp. NBC_00582]WUB66295.1 PAS domain-containing SpoIIE family protein phosphatase/ATP-binding protein [Streptomyces sp. NBC_00582]
MGTLDEDGLARRRFDVADAAPLLLDGLGVVTSWTRDAERLLGYPASDAVGRDLAALLTEGDAGRVPEILERCRRDGGWSGLLSARRGDGRPVPVMARVTCADEPGGADRRLVLLSEMGDAPGWAMSRSVLEQMVSDSPIGIAVVDTDLRFVWSNDALARFGGGRPEQRLGLRLGDVQPGLDAAAAEAQMRRVLADGGTVVGYEHVGHVRAAPHRETAHMLSFTRLDDGRGNPVGVYYTVVDITDRHRARQRLALLDRAGRCIGGSLDIARTAQELADVAVPDFADAVAVDLPSPVLRGAEPSPDPPGSALPGPPPLGTRPTRGPSVAPPPGTEPGPVRSEEAVTLRRAGLRGAGVGGSAGAVAPGVVYPADSPPVRCLRTGRPWHGERLEASAETWLGNLPAAAPGDPVSVLVVPVRARGVTLGVTTFLRRGPREPFDADDLALAEDLVSRAAVCVDNARRYTRERDAALVLQRDLLPHRLPEQEAVEVAACYRPADELTGLGGDWYDLIPLSAARVALVVGEVPGHGIDAAAAMGRVRTAVRTLAALDLPPQEVLAHLDDLVARMARDEGLEAGTQAQGAGCLYVVYDPVDGRCAMAAAGHPAPAVVLPDGKVTFVDLPQGPALGAGGLPFESVELTLPEGSTLALHTDGLLAQGGAWALDADRTRLRQALERRAPSLDLRCRSVIDALVPARPYDDVALLMARTHRLPADRVADWELPADPAAVAEARRTASRRLVEWGLPELSFTTELVVSELVTNAIRYATGPIRLRLIRERSLVCEVFDGGATAPHLRHPRTTDEGGRGLLLVSQVSERWGTRFLGEGKIIWAEQSLTDPGV